MNIKKITGSLTAIVLLLSSVQYAPKAEALECGSDIRLNGTYIQTYTPGDEEEFYSYAPVVGATDLPTAYDLRQEGCVTPVRNQGAEGMCHAFAAVGSCESNLLKQGLETDCEALDLSEAQLGYFLYTMQKNPLDSRYGDYINTPNKGADGGNGILAASGLAVGYGTQYEKYCDYDRWQYGYNEYLRYTGKYRLSRMETVSRAETLEAKNTIKSWLMERGGVSFAFYSQRTLYYDNGTSYSYYAENKSFYENANHAALVVGWDDNYSKENFKPGSQPANDGAWLVKNSYGVDMFDDGYFWLSYEDPACGSFCSYVMEECSSYDDVYEYDGAGYITAYTFDAAANIFTAEYDCTLTDVSFYMPDKNPAGTAYTIEIYKLRENTANPTDGECISVLEDTTASGGYFKVPLSQSAELKKGEQFSVIISMEAPRFSQKVYIPIEETISLQTNFVVNCGSKANESYFLSDGQWTDSFGQEGDYGAFGNVPVKAFAVRTDGAESVMLDTALAKAAASTSSNAFLRQAEAEAIADINSSAAMKHGFACTLFTYLTIVDGSAIFPQYLYADTGAVCGDSDGDGSIAIGDAMEVLRVYANRAAGSIIRLTKGQEYAMDAVSNGEIKINDAAEILSMYAENAAGK